MFSENLTALDTSVAALFSGSFGSNYIGALAVIVVSFILAKLANFVFEKVLPKITGRTETDIDDRIFAAIHNPVYYTILLAGLFFAENVMGVSGGLDLYFERVVESALVIVISVAVYRVINILVEFFGTGFAARSKTSIDDHILPFLKNAVKLVVIVLAIFQILAIWGKDITPLLASAGIAGLAIAFAAKDTLANMLGGISIYFDRPFRLGDRVQLESGEIGDVYEIGIRTTRLKTLDDTVIIIPNERMANSKIVNYNLPVPRTNVRMKIGVAYGSDVAKVKKTLLKVAGSAQLALKEPKPAVLFTEHGDFSLNFVLVVWIADPTHSPLVKDQINEGIDREFRKEKIEIPFPTHTIYQKKG